MRDKRTPKDVCGEAKFLMVGTQQLLRRLPSKISISFLGKEITPVFRSR